MSSSLFADDSATLTHVQAEPLVLQSHEDSAVLAPGADNDSASGDSDSDRPHKRLKSSRELPPEAVTVFRSWLLSEKNFSHPVRDFKVARPI